MIRRAIAHMPLALAAGFLGAHRAPAQVAPSITLGTAWRAPSPASSFTAIRIDPSLQLDRPAARLFVDGAAAVWDGSARLEAARGAANVLPWARGPLALEVAGEVSHARLHAAGRTGTEWRTEARAHLRARAGGVWLGVGATRPAAAAWPRPGPGLTAGGWIRLGKLSAWTSVDYAARSVARVGSLPGPIDTLADTLPAPEPAPEAPSAARSVASSGQLWARWDGGSVQVEASLGVLSVDRRRPYRSAEVQVQWWLSPNLALTVGGGVGGPRPLSLGAAGQRYLSAGVRVAGPARIPDRAPLVARAGRSGLRVRDAGDGLRTIELFGLRARRVELLADFTDWMPRSLVPSGDERWTITLPIAPGLHQACVRIDDGPCQAPPGAPTARDGFAGLVGIIVVE